MLGRSPGPKLSVTACLLAPCLEKQVILPIGQALSHLCHGALSPDAGSGLGVPGESPQQAGPLRPGPVSPRGCLCQSLWDWETPV
jgi:hypothetical protein